MLLQRSTSRIIITNIVYVNFADNIIMITVEYLDSLFINGEIILRNCGAGAPKPGTAVYRDYAMYNISTATIDAVGFYWNDEETVAKLGKEHLNFVFNVRPTQRPLKSSLVKIIRAAKVKENSVSDHYIIYGRDKKYFSAQIDPVSFSIICRYKIEANGYEPKVDINDNILQDNYNVSSWQEMPEEFKNRLISDNFPFLDNIYCWAPKPYGTCVEFEVSKIFNTNV